MITGPNPCWFCNKDLKETRTMEIEIEVVDGGRVRKETDPPANTTDSGYMGWYPIGPDCARKLRAQGAAICTSLRK